METSDEEAPTIDVIGKNLFSYLFVFCCLIIRSTVESWILKLNSPRAIVIRKLYLRVLK